MIWRNQFSEINHLRRFHIKHRVCEMKKTINIAIDKCSFGENMFTAFQY